MKTIFQSPYNTYHTHTASRIDAFNKKKGQTYHPPVWPSTRNRCVFFRGEDLFDVNLRCFFSNFQCAESSMAAARWAGLAAERPFATSATNARLEPGWLWVFSKFLGTQKKKSKLTTKKRSTNKTSAKDWWVFSKDFFHPKLGVLLVRPGLQACQGRPDNDTKKQLPGRKKWKNLVAQNTPKAAKHPKGVPRNWSKFVVFLGNKNNLATLRSPAKS